MRCPRCQYPLWNLKARTCPECGTAFRPSEHEFAANSVRFCCPHCDQEYYGTGANGHLEPPSFVCVTCHAPLTMDEMVLRPAAGVEEERTHVDRCPWLERRRSGRFKSWLRTIGRAMVTPPALIRAVPVESGTGQAWWFAGVTLAIYLTGGGGALLLVIGIVAMIGGGPGNGLEPLAFTAGLVFGGTALAGVFIALWGFLTHGLLLVTGGTNHPIGRTYQALCYSAGAAVTLAVPCIGLYPFAFVGICWWLVSAVLMVAVGQGVHGGRATIATLLLPALLGLAVVGGGVSMMFWGMSQARIAAAQAVSSRHEAECMTLLTGLLDAAETAGAWPAHGIALLEADGAGTYEFVAVDSETVESGVPVGDDDLGAIGGMGPGDRRRAIDVAASRLPPDVVAHRVGDFVFAYHGIDFGLDPDGDAGALWLLVMSPDPDANTETAISGVIVVGKRDRTVESIPEPAFPERLAEQNALRAEHGLPPLASPAQITHAAPQVMD